MNLSPFTTTTRVRYFQRRQLSEVLEIGLYSPAKPARLTGYVYLHIASFMIQFHIPVLVAAEAAEASGTAPIRRVPEHDQFGGRSAGRLKLPQTSHSHPHVT